jgi:DNA repair exonuclease SbcCD ATPase subunit
MIPQMNQWASTYSALFDSKFDVKFSAQTKLKKGDFAEKFDVMAFNKVGAQVYEGNSGGEKRVIDVIVMFILGDLASSRSSKRFSILVLDEVFERLDEEICDKVIYVLRSMVSGCFGMDCAIPQRESIFVLTHLDYFKSKFENRIRTWKDRDETRIYDGG